MLRFDCHPLTAHPLTARLLPALLVTTLIAPVTATIADEVEGFTEPYRQVELAAADTGLIDTIYAREGQAVSAGELVATLDQQLLEASQRIAQRHVDAVGKLDSARAELQLREARATKFRTLLTRSHATREEVDRAEIERDIAAAAVVMAEEEREIRRLERDRIDVQLDRRTVRSPIDGIVIERHKDSGEFVSPADPIVMTVVQLDPLLATFNVPEDAELIEGDAAEVTLLKDERTVTAQIDFVSPVIEADSGTVRVRVRIPNSDRSIRAGEQCVLEIGRIEQVAGR